jgi:hypothetical protein
MTVQALHHHELAARIRRHTDTVEAPVAGRISREPVRAPAPDAAPRWELAIARLASPLPRRAW